jgi:peroxiredoxin
MVQIAIFSIVVVIGMLTLASNLFSDKSKPLQGDKAPDFALAGLDGKVYRLSDYKGKSVVVNFWGTFCPPCKEEMPAIQSVYDSTQRSDIEIIGVSLDKSSITVKSFVDQYSVKFPIVMDDKEEIRKKYGVVNYPTTFFINPNGDIVEIKVGQMSKDYLQRTTAASIGK